MLSKEHEVVSEIFAKTHNLDPIATAQMMSGVLDLLSSVVKDGEAVTEELIQLATVQWFKNQEKFFNEYIHDVDGAREKLHNEVYDQLKASIDD